MPGLSLWVRLRMHIVLFNYKIIIYKINKLNKNKPTISQCLYPFFVFPDLEKTF